MRGIAGPERIWHLPEDIDRLVQAVYGDDPFEAEEREEYLKTLDRALGEHLAALQEQRQRAANAALDAQAEITTAFDKPRANEEGEGVGLRVVTRLGEDSISAVPVLVSEAGWRLVPSDAPFNPHAEPNDVVAHRIFRRQLRLSRKDLVTALRERPRPPAFESHPLLRNLYPLVLTDGAALFDNLRVRLDSELGITYEKLETESK